MTCGSNTIRSRELGANTRTTIRNHLLFGTPRGGGGYLTIYRITNESPQDVIVVTEPGVTLRLKGSAAMGIQSSIDVSSVKLTITPAIFMQSGASPIRGTYQLMCCTGCCPKEVFPRPASDSDGQTHSQPQG